MKPECVFYFWLKLLAFVMLPFDTSYFCSSYIIDSPSTAYVHRPVHELSYCYDGGSAPWLKLVFDTLYEKIVHNKAISFVDVECNSNEFLMRPCRVSYSGAKSIDRTCLLTIQQFDDVREEILYDGDCSPGSIVQFVSNVTRSFLSLDESLSGLRNAIHRSTNNPYKIQSGEVCDSVDISTLDPDFFFKNYLLPQRPVVIKGVWEGKNRLGDILRRHYYANVDVKLSPSSAFEGVEDLSHWGGQNAQKVPDLVLSQLESPELVVVRAAHKTTTLKVVLDAIAEKHQLCQHKNTSSSKSCPEMSMYIEYLSLNTHVPGLLEDILGYMTSSYSKMSNNFLNGKPYLWLGDGQTVGKLHFDAFDNILVQLEGSKTFRIADASSNERFYEGHMRESMIEVFNLGEYSDYSSQLLNYKFRKRKLLESTSMVHSPVDISHADIIKYPLAINISYFDCTVNEGDAFFLPSFFWHEVTSAPGHSRQYTPSSDIQLNAALNYWFDPIFIKDFPCKSCRKHFNYDLYGVHFKRLFEANEEMFL